jgi:hypothetical protein
MLEGGFFTQNVLRGGIHPPMVCRHMIGYILDVQRLNSVKEITYGKATSRTGSDALGKTRKSKSPVGPDPAILNLRKNFHPSGVHVPFAAATLIIIQVDMVKANI